MFRKENAMECHPIVENGNEAICQEYVRSAIGLKPGCVLGPREQMNFATAFLDGSGIYGSTPKSSEDLRLLKGRLRIHYTNFNSEYYCKNTAAVLYTGDVGKF